MPVIASSSSLFAKRGDPWLTEREAIKDFERDILTENPDFDQFAAASVAKPKAAFYQEPGKPIENDFSRRAANFMLKTHSLTRERGIIVAEGRKALANLPSIEVVRKKQAQSYWIYSVRKDGQEEEVERNVGLDKAKILFERVVKKDECVLVELYDFKGELIHRWERRK